VHVEVPPAAQSCVPLAHSSTSEQVTPSPVKPLLQTQVRPPLVFEQVASAEQPPLAVWHSSTSMQAPPEAT
jgi:hypothetical protein